MEWAWALFGAAGESEHGSESQSPHRRRTSREDAGLHGRMGTAEKLEAGTQPTEKRAHLCICILQRERKNVNRDMQKGIWARKERGGHRNGERKAEGKGWARSSVSSVLYWPTMQGALGVVSHTCNSSIGGEG